VDPSNSVIVIESPNKAALDMVQVDYLDYYLIPEDSLYNESKNIFDTPGFILFCFV